MTFQRLPILLSAGASAACVTPDENARAEREYRRGEFQAEFLEYKLRCEDKGGTVVIRARNKRRHDRLPQPGDLYHCDYPGARLDDL